MPKLAHSAKTLETLRLLDCDTTGWDFPEIKWEERVIPWPTKVTCPACHGTGRVPDAEARAKAEERLKAGEKIAPYERHADKRCSKCPPHRNRPAYGTGEVVELKPTKMLVGIIQWPKGTKFDSRFSYGRGNQCELCGKAPIRHWVAVLGKNRSGEWIGMWVGEDCARTILGVSDKNISFAKASADAADNRAEMQAFKALPKTPKPVKPPKPALLADQIPKQYEFEAIAKEAFGELRTSRLENSRALATYRFSVTLPGGTGTGFDVVLDVRHGVRIKDDWQDKPIVKEKTQDILKVFRDSIPKLKERVQYAAQKRKEQGWG